MSISERAVAAVSGGASGIGLAFARRWLDSGGIVYLLDARESALIEAKAELGSTDVEIVTCDVTDTESVERAFDELRQRHGRLDVLVNSAGFGRPAPSESITDADWDAVLGVHLGGAMRLSRAAFPLLREAGASAIVNLSSGAAVSGMPGRLSYTTAKAGIEGLTRTLAVEWAPHGIRVNAVAPGYVRTRLTDLQIEQGKLRIDPIIARTPMRRFAEPSEIAEVIYFLAGAGASYVTGHSLVADGGLTIDGDWY